MNKILKEVLEKKGWPKKDIEQAMGIIHSEEKKKKHEVFKSSGNRVLYWIALLILLKINFLIAIILIPFLLVLTGLSLYLTIVIIALLFGLIYNFIINDIEHLEQKHHVFAGLAIPIIAIINLSIIVTTSNKISVLLNIPIHNNPVSVSIVYVIVFILPYIISKIK